MYLTHFGLRGFPFTNDIAPDEMFESEANAELITRLNLLRVQFAT